MAPEGERALVPMDFREGSERSFWRGLFEAPIKANHPKGWDAKPLA
jgi:hypothetical protein